MKKRMKQLLAMGMVSALSLSVLSGCGDNSSKKEESVTQEVEKESEAQESEKESETQVDEKDMPVLKVIMPFNEQNDLELVEEAANEILMAKIGAKIDLQYIPSGTYGEKMNYKYTAGEAWDVCFTSNWMNNVDKAVDNEVFMPLDDLINEYCPALWDEMADYWWDAAKYDGQVYAVPNQQLIVGYSGLCIDKKWADKYELDAKSVKTIDDIEPFLQQIADNETEVWAYQPYGNWWTQNFAEISTCVGYNYNAEDLTAMFCWEDEGWLLGIEKQ